MAGIEQAYSYEVNDRGQVYADDGKRSVKVKGSEVKEQKEPASVFWFLKPAAQKGAEEDDAESDDVRKLPSHDDDDSEAEIHAARGLPPESAESGGKKKRFVLIGLLLLLLVVALGAYAGMGVVNEGNDGKDTTTKSAVTLQDCLMMQKGGYPADEPAAQADAKPASQTDEGYMPYESSESDEVDEVGEPSGPEESEEEMSMSSKSEKAPPRRGDSSGRKLRVAFADMTSYPTPPPSPFPSPSLADSTNALPPSPSPVVSSIDSIEQPDPSDRQNLESECAELLASQRDDKSSKATKSTKTSKASKSSKSHKSSARGSEKSRGPKADALTEGPKGETETETYTPTAVPDEKVYEPYDR